MADGTLSQNSRELEDREVADVTELAPEGNGISQDVEDILDGDHVPSSVVDEEEPVKINSIFWCVFVKLSRCRESCD